MPSGSQVGQKNAVGARTVISLGCSRARRRGTSTECSFQCSVRLFPRKVRYSLYHRRKKGASGSDRITALHKPYCGLKPFFPKHRAMVKQIVEVSLHEYISVEVNSADFQKSFQTNYIGPMSRVDHGISKNFPRSFDCHWCHHFARKIPPGTRGLVFEIKQYLFRT